MIDSHCHIHDRSTYNYAYSRQQIGKKLLKKYPDLPHEPADFTPEKIISRAHAAGVNKMICIGTSHDDSLVARDFALQHSADGIFWSYGIHPDEASELESFSSEHLATNGAQLFSPTSAVATRTGDEPCEDRREERFGENASTLSLVLCVTI